MNALLAFVIKRPVGVICALIMVILFGGLSIFNLPYQLTPSISKPTIAVITTWSGANPYDIEQNILIPQEKMLKNIPGLKTMQSRARTNQGSIRLQFDIDVDLTKTIVDVTNALTKVHSYPENVDKPVVKSGDEDSSEALWMLVSADEGLEGTIYQYRTYFNDNIIPLLERVDGVSGISFYGGVNKKISIVFDYKKLADYKISVNELIGAIRSTNSDASAGSLDLSRRAYNIKTSSRYEHLEDIKKTVIKSDGNKRVLLKDVAKVSIGYAKPTVPLLRNGNPTMAIGVKVDTTANVVEVTNEVEKVYKRIQKDLKVKHIKLDWVQDNRGFIESAVRNVFINMSLGALLAVSVLFIFLKRVAPTIVISIVMPISALGTFIAMNILDRSLNTISLAGIAFAVGMLVDCAIVVIENIDRHHNMGKTIAQSSYDGTKEVGSALVASVATTVAIFIPIILMKEEAAQLFKDIAITTTGAVSLSLIMSVFVVPTFNNLLGKLVGDKAFGEFLYKEHPMPRLDKIGAIFRKRMLDRADRVLATKESKLKTIASFTMGCLIMSYLIFPETSYLPRGNRNFFQGIIISTSGLSYEERDKAGHRIFETLRKLDAYATDKKDGIKEAFYIGIPASYQFLGAFSSNEANPTGVMEPLQKALMNIPGAFGFVQQSGIFEDGGSSSTSVKLRVIGSNMEELSNTTKILYGMTMKAFKGKVSVRPVPSLDINTPEVRFLPNSDKLKAAGLTNQSFGSILDVLMDGRKIDEFKQSGKNTIDIVLQAEDKNIKTPEDLYNTQIYTPKKGVVPLSSLSIMERGYGVDQIRREERERTITLIITPKDDIPLSELVKKIQKDIVDVAKKQGILKDGVKLRVSGSADKLSKMQKSLAGGFILAMIIVYLLMSALYSDFVYPMIIMFTIPMAIAGGLMALQLVHIFVPSQQLDVLTMLGFLILVGTVVNNAILIVYQSIDNVRYGGMQHNDAIKNAIEIRLQPIYMSLLTTLGGILPMVLSPAVGSEVYRGLGAVMLGGLALSTLLTLLVIPAILSFFITKEVPNSGDILDKEIKE